MFMTEWNILMKIIQIAIIDGILIALMVLIINLVKNLNFGIKARESFAKIYQLLIKTYNILLVIIFLTLFLDITLLISKILVWIVYTILILIGENLVDEQIKFLMVTMISIFYYPGSILMLKWYTISRKDDKSLFILMFNKSIEMIKKFPLEEIINILYVILLFYSSFNKIGNTNTSIDSNYVYLSFIIYITVQTTASKIYKKHISFFNKIDNRIFKTDSIKNESKKMDLDNNLDVTNNIILEFIRTGKISKESEKYLKKINKYIENMIKK